ncbi:hypothetical protein [Alicyclobacillus macrosporangiidus]|nr:hypothetical protein [Alicyclobacillus macrosporangiidus]
MEALTWAALQESLAHWLYWAVLLALLIGGIVFFSRRDARRKTHRDK